MSLEKPIVYLEKTDVNDGSLKSYVVSSDSKKPIPAIVMIQSNSCGHCQDAKPTYQKLANNYENSVRCCTVSLDNEGKSLNNFIKKCYPDMPGVPSFLGFDSSGNFKKVYNGDRSYSSLSKFADSL